MTHAEQLPDSASRRFPRDLGAAFLTLAIAIPLAFSLNLWQDEAYTLHTTSASLPYAFRAAIGFEQNAPLYFVLLTLWRHLGDNVFFLRLFSVLCIGGTVALMPPLARRYLPGVNPTLVTMVAALNPFAIWAAVDMRAYALIVLLSALLLFAFYEAFLRERPTAAATILYGSCVAVALYTQYYFAFLIAAQCITLIALRRPALGRFFLAAAGGAVAFLPMLAIVPGQVANFKDGFAAPSLPHSLIGLAGILLRYELPLPLTHSRLVDAVCVAALILTLAILRPRLKFGATGAIVLMTLVASLLFAIGTYFGGVHILDRHAASLYVPATLAVFGAIAFLPGIAARRATAIWSVAIIVLSLATLGRTYRALANAGDWARVAEYLELHERPGEPIVVFEAENALPLKYYYHGVNPVVPIPAGVDFKRYDVTAFVIHDSSQLGSTMPAAERIWLVEAGGCRSANLIFGCPVLERFVDARYRSLSEVSFYGSTVRLLERKAPPR